MVPALALAVQPLIGSAHLGATLPGKRGRGAGSEPVPKLAPMRSESASEAKATPIAKRDTESVAFALPLTRNPAKRGETASEARRRIAGG